MVTDDLDRVLVSTYSTIRTKTPELTACCTSWSNINFRDDWQGMTCNIINDTDCEVVLWLICFQVLIDRDDGTWSNVLRTKAVTTANDIICLAFFECCCTDINI